MDTATRQGHLFDAVLDGPNDGFLPTSTATRMETMARPRLRAMLEQARGAQRMPWQPSEERANANVFHTMAAWLPEPERNALRAEFLAELDRLRAAT